MTEGKDPLRFFRLEAREIADEMSSGALQLERGVTPEIIARLLRLAHTLKGAASVVRQRAIAQSAHELEDSLVLLRDHESPPDGLPGGILAQVRAISAQVTGLEPHAAGKQADEKSTDEPSADEPFSLLRADTAELDSLLRGIAEAGRELRNLRRTTDLIEQIRHLADLIHAAAGANIEHAADDLRDLVASLSRALKDGIDRSDREMQEVRATAERLRLLPCGVIFAPLKRAALDVGQSLGKSVAVETRGNDCRLDGHVLNIVQRALVQLVRNAVSHGIEFPAARLKAGKPETGLIRIEAVRRGDRIAFVCTDDGAGIDLAAVRAKGIARGLISADAGPDEILQLLFHSGLSTSDVASEVSGRGVGMDVVREAVSRLDGEVVTRTEPGRGATIELIVPVSLSSLEALLVETNGVVSAVPLSAVRRVQHLVATDVTQTADGEIILFEDRAIPYAPLAQLLEDGAVQAPASMRSAIILDAGEDVVAVGVHRLHGVATLIVRPVPSLAFCNSLVAGLRLDPEGVPQPVLDAEALAVALRAAGAVVRAVPDAPPPILVIDDSLTTRILEQSILESAGYEVDLATCAEEGLEKARQRRYGLFLVDVEMPGMDGFTFVRTIRDDPELGSTPAILVTSLSSPEHIQRGTEAGAQAYIIKGEFDQNKVLETIRNLLGRR